MAAVIRGRLSVSALVLCLCGVLYGTADAQPRRDASRVERQSNEARAEAARLRRQAQTAQTEIGRLNDRLVIAGRRRAQAEAAATAAELRLEELHRRQREESVARARDQQAFEDLLIASAFAERTDSRDGIRARTFARATGPTVAARYQDRTQTLIAAAQLETEITAEQARLASAQAEIERDRANVATLISQRRALRATLVANASAAERRATTLAREARSLRELAQRATASATPRRASATPARPAVLPASWTTLASGSVVRGYGVRDTGGQTTQGVTIRPRAGAQVRAPAAGQVAFAGPFRSYGHVLILNLDGGYALVLTGMQTLRVGAGDSVGAGQPIGEMSSSDTAAPELYVEVRRDGRPIDPTAWLGARGAGLAQAN